MSRARNITFERRGGNGTAERLAALAAELVALKVDLIVAIATPAARAAQQATSTIPIVADSVGDAVQDGFAASLAHPGGNITGARFLGPELVPKRFALLKELLPKAINVAVLWNPQAFDARTTAGMVEQTNEVAKTLAVQLQYIEVPSLDQFERAVGAAAKRNVDALFQFPIRPSLRIASGLSTSRRNTARPRRTISREFVEVGGLIGYGASPVDINRRTAFYVDRIIRGAKPADLPIEQPTTFDLSINRSTAKTLGIDIPTTLLAAADQLID